MATQLQIRRGTTAQMNAFTGAEGELAVNTSTDTVHVHDGSTAGGFALAKADGSNIGTYAGSFTTISASGAITANGGIALGDSDKATFGASDDLQIYHDGTHSRIVDAGTGNLNLQGDNLRLKTADAAGTYLEANNGGAVTITYNSSPKLATTSTGIDVTGSVTADGLTVDGNARIEEIGAIAKLTLERGGTANSADSAAVDMLETNSGTEGANFGDLGTNGFRLKLDGSANDFLIQSGAANVINTRFGIDRDTGDISFYEDTGTTPKFFWDASAESLGIGTSSPNIANFGKALTILDSAASNQIPAIELAFGSNTRGANIAVDNRASVKALAITAVASDLAMTFGTNNTERMRIDSSGNVGIGVSSLSGVKMDVLATASDNLVARFENNHATGSYGISVKAGDDSGNYAADFANKSGTSLMRIRGDGNVGIGTSSPTGELHVKSASGNANFYLQRSVYDPWRLSAGSGYLAFLQDSSEKMRLSGGNLLVGTSVSGFGLAVYKANSDGINSFSGSAAGSSRSLYTGWHSASSSTTGTLAFNVTTNGNVTNINNSYGSLSDIKLKKNVEDATPKLADISRVRVVNYNLISSPDVKQLGVVAQELEQIFPSMVDETPDRDEDGNDLGTVTKSVKYSVFVPMLIKAMQEQQATIEALTQRIETLENT